MALSSLLSRVVILVFGTLYPAYCSYKAIKTKNVKEYVRWMMYWIVYALFITLETFADTLLFWFPLYYEIKIVFLIWLLSPMTKGSTFLYRKFIHTKLLVHEQEIDTVIDQVKSRGYTALHSVGTQGLTLALEGVATGHQRLLEKLKHSYTLSTASRVERDKLVKSNESIAAPQLQQHQQNGEHLDQPDYTGIEESLTQTKLVAVASHTVTSTSQNHVHLIRIDNSSATLTDQDATGDAKTSENIEMSVVSQKAKANNTRRTRESAAAGSRSKPSRNHKSDSISSVTVQQTKTVKRRQSKSRTRSSSRARCAALSKTGKT